MNQFEKDRLIEKFMGWELKCSNEEGLKGWSFHNKRMGKMLHKTTYVDSVIGYTTNWNELMNALWLFDNLIECNSLGFNQKQLKVYSCHCDSIDNAVTLYNINDAVNALCEGIEWYNSTIN
jgi:hypothetical protein